jgi:S-adenosylmethionine hydrolase
MFEDNLRRIFGDEADGSVMEEVHEYDSDCGNGNYIEEEQNFLVVGDEKEPENIEDCSDAEDEGDDNFVLLSVAFFDHFGDEDIGEVVRSDHAHHKKGHA